MNGADPVSSFREQVERRYAEEHWIMEATKSKEEVDYRRSSGDQRCANCKNYSDETCKIVEGKIKPMDVCDLWTKK